MNFESYKFPSISFYQMEAPFESYKFPSYMFYQIKSPIGQSIFTFVQYNALQNCLSTK